MRAILKPLAGRLPENSSMQARVRLVSAILVSQQLGIVGMHAGLSGCLAQRWWWSFFLDLHWIIRLGRLFNSQQSHMGQRRVYGTMKLIVSSPSTLPCSFSELQWGLQYGASDKAQPRCIVVLSNDTEQRFWQPHNNNDDARQWPYHNAFLGGLNGSRFLELSWCLLLSHLQVAAA